MLVLLYWLRAILMPFVLGAGLAYCGDPLVDWLEKRKLSRTAGVVVVFVMLGAFGLAVLVLLLPLLQQQLVQLLHSVPDWLRWLQDVGLPAIGVHLPAGVRLDYEGLRHIVAENWQQAGDLLKTALATATKSGTALLTFAADLVLLPVVTFYLLRDWDRLVAWVDDAIPRRWLPKVQELARETDAVLAHFIRGQLTVMAALAAYYALGLWLAGLELALLIGVGAGLVSFVPYLGFITGILAATVAMLVQSHEWLPLVWVWLVFGIGHVLEGAVLVPWLVGDRIGLHPVAVIFAILAGGQLFGILGVLLALPAAAVLAVLLRHAKRYWHTTHWYLGE